MYSAIKVKPIYFTALFIAFAGYIFSVKNFNAQDHYHFSSNFDPEERQDLKNFIPALRDTPPVKRIDTVSVQDTFNIKLSKDSLEGPISYSAEDSMIYDVPAKKITLYGKTTRTTYLQNELTAPRIEYDQASGNITASIQRDSNGKVISLPTFKQGDFVSQSDSIKFNLKTGKGLTKSTYTQQGEMYVYGETIKKVSPDIFYVKRGRFTTCDLDTPHFAFVSNKIKFVNRKVAISGPVHPEFEGVPVPIYLPFGIYPLNQARHSGFMAPTFAANEQLGLGLENGGYYKILGPYWDVILRGNVYSYGGYTLTVNPRYSKRYRYNGSFTFNMQNIKVNHKGDPDYSSNKSYNITWTHSMDNKARPGVNFSANVNAGSSSYNSYVPNNPYRNISNQMYSSISYSKTWKDKPFNLSINANHNQNTLQKLINVNLPDVAFNVNTIYPFRKKERAGELKWYENLGIAYNGNAKSLFSFYDTASNVFKHIIDTLQWGAHHSVPVNISLPQIGPFQLTPGMSYEETWYQRKFIRSWNEADKKVDTTIQKGFYTARQMTFSLSLATRIFGLIASKNKNSRIQAIRHEIRPSISLNYKPDLNKNNYYYTQIDTSGRKSQFSVFEGNIFGPYAPGKFGGMSFGIDNNLQMKVRNKKDTSNGGLKKISLIDGFSINGAYNFMADSFQLSTFNMSLRSTLFEKLNITANATLDPYDVDEKGQRVKTLIWRRKPISLGRMTNGNISISSNFQGGNKKTGTGNSNKQMRNPGIPNGYTTDEYNTEMAYIQNNPAEYMDFNIPWSLNFAYALRFNKIFKSDYSGFRTDLMQDVSFSGTLGLTRKWQISMTGFYNITQKELGNLSLSIGREMHCWQMAISLSPVGRYRFFSINISPKSALLRDLRINRTRSFYDF